MSTRKLDINTNDDGDKKKPRLDLLKKAEQPRSQDIVFEIFTRCLEHKTCNAVAINLVNELAHHFRCVRVCVGLREGKHTRVTAISNSAHFDPKTNLIRAIGLAMDEGIDQAATIVLPVIDDTETLVTRAHKQLVTLEGGRSICTIPLWHGNQIIGSLMLEQSAKRSCDTDKVKLAQQMAKLAGPLLHLLYREHRGVTQKGSDAVGIFLTTLLGKQKAALKFTALGIIAVLAFLSLYSTNYRVTSNAVVQGSIQRVVAAPIDGYIASAMRRAGDSVHKDDLIATLDDKDLQLQMVKWQSTEQQLKREYRESLATSDRTQVSILTARIKQANAQMELVSEQLSRLNIVAPFDGVIIEGDLSQSVGSPVTRGDVLFRVSPKDDYRIMLEVDESEISQIQTGQTGQLSLSSLPDETLSLQIKRITPVSATEGGRNYFRVEAELTSISERLQPGMEGIAKVSIEERKLIWILTHKVTDRLRILSWSLLP